MGSPCWEKFGLPHNMVALRKPAVSWWFRVLHSWLQWNPPGFKGVGIRPHPWVRSGMILEGSVEVETLLQPSMENTTGLKAQLRFWGDGHGAVGLLFLPTDHACIHQHQEGRPLRAVWPQCRGLWLVAGAVWSLQAPVQCHRTSPSLSCPCKTTWPCLPGAATSGRTTSIIKSL